jgi:hypothetical protein
LDFDLIAEELLIEATQAEENLFSTAMLFAGSLVLLALKLFSQSASGLIASLDL